MLPPKIPWYSTLYAKAQDIFMYTQKPKIFMWALDYLYIQYSGSLLNEEWSLAVLSPNSQSILGCSSNNRCKRRHMLNLQIIIMPLPEAYERDSGVRTKGSYTGVELTQQSTRSTVLNLLQLSPNPLRISYCSALWPRWPASTNSRQLGCGRPGHDSCSNGAGTVQDYAHNNCSPTHHGVVRF